MQEGRQGLAGFKHHRAQNRMVASRVRFRQLPPRQGVPRGRQRVFAVKVLPGPLGKEGREIVVRDPLVLPGLKPHEDRRRGEQGKHGAQHRQPKDQLAQTRFVAPPVPLPEIVEVGVQQTRGQTRHGTVAAILADIQPQRLDRQIVRIVRIGTAPQGRGETLGLGVTRVWNAVDDERENLAVPPPAPEPFDF